MMFISINWSYIHLDNLVFEGSLGILFDLPLKVLDISSVFFLFETLTLRMLITPSANDKFDIFSFFFQRK